MWTKENIRGELECMGGSHKALESVAISVT